MSSLNLQRPGAIIISVLTNQEKKNDLLWLAKVVTFDEPSGYATFAGGRSPTFSEAAEATRV
jgi:hypothetical protein